MEHEEVIPKELFEMIEDLCRIHGIKRIKTPILGFFDLLEHSYNKKGE